MTCLLPMHYALLLPRVLIEMFIWNEDHPVNVYVFTFSYHDEKQQQRTGKDPKESPVAFSRMEITRINLSIENQKPTLIHSVIETSSLYGAADIFKIE